MRQPSDATIPELVAVALDFVTRRVIMSRRRAAGLSDKMSESRHIETAAKKGLGVGDLSGIDVLTVQL